MEYRYSAIILGKKDIGEADRMYILYTKEEGKIVVKAPGSRKNGAKLSSHLETGMLSSVSIMRSRGMGRVTSAFCEQSFFEEDLIFPIAHEMMNILYYMNRYTVEHDKNENIFDLLMSFLKKAKHFSILGKEERFSLMGSGFLFQLLSHMGFSFEISRCVSCLEKLEGEQFFFGIQQGGILCSNCSLIESVGLEIEKNNIKLFRLFATNAIENLGKIHVSRKQSDQMRNLLEMFFRNLE
ncbi:MAG: DNA repair protein RecO [Candidatus Moraniibacteriota bacterium]|nr:MAG: DNA repair protein RecO [Candidatus Moranbacteria bacterium]